jgi:hypothetical protein
MGYNMLGTSKKCDSNGKDENSSGSFTPLNTLEFIGIRSENKDTPKWLFIREYG